MWVVAEGHAAIVSSNWRASKRRALRRKKRRELLPQLPQVLLLVGTEMASLLAERVDPGDQPQQIVGRELDFVMSLLQQFQDRVRR